MSAHHLNVNRASCRGATYRVAGQASGALVAHFYYIGHGNPRQGPFHRRHRAVDCRDGRRAREGAQIACSSSETRSCASPAALAQRYWCVLARCARVGCRFRNILLSIASTAVMLKNDPNSDPIRPRMSHMRFLRPSPEQGSLPYACPGHSQSRVLGR